MISKSSNNSFLAIDQLIAARNFNSPDAKVRRLLRRMAGQGWELYPKPSVNGHFDQDLELIARLIGSTLYEVAEDNDCGDGVARVWVRRIQD